MAQGKEGEKDAAMSSASTRGSFDSKPGPEDGLSDALSAADVQCEVYTFKEGLLSKVAHDLLIRAPCATLSVAGSPPRVEASFRAADLRTVCAMRDGRQHPAALSAKDLRKIDESTRADVLHTSRHPEIRFVAQAVDPAATRLHGQLTLHGQTRPVGASVSRDGDRLVARFDLDQRDFGIQPFSAMLGALRIQPRVTVVVTVGLSPSRRPQ